MEIARQWEWEGYTSDSFDEKVQWLGELRRLGYGADKFFLIASKIFAVAKTDFVLATPALFHAIVGLERSLQLHYKSPTEVFSDVVGLKDPLRKLMDRLLRDEEFKDFSFSNTVDLSEIFSGRKEAMPEKKIDQLFVLVHQFRNNYAHGHFQFFPETLPISLQLREIADALKTRPTKNLLE